MMRRNVAVVLLSLAREKKDEPCLVLRASTEERSASRRQRKGCVCVCVSQVKTMGMPEVVQERAGEEDEAGGSSRQTMQSRRWERGGG